MLARRRPALSVAQTVSMGDEMARFQLTRAIYADPPGPGRLRAGTWITTTPAEMQRGDVFWPNAPAQSNLPTGPVTTILGVDSVDG